MQHCRTTPSTTADALFVTIAATEDACAAAPAPPTAAAALFAHSHLVFVVEVSLHPTGTDVCCSWLMLVSRMLC